MSKRFFEQEISMGSEWQKRLLQMCRESAHRELSLSPYFSIFTWKSSMSEGPDHDEFHSQQTDVDIAYQIIVRMEYFRKMNFLVRNCWNKEP